MNTDNRTLEIRIDEAARRLVQNEVIACLSSLVSTLAEGYGDTGNPISGRRSALAELTEEALELCAPVQDWEEAALQAGIEIRERNSLFYADLKGMRHEGFGTKEAAAKAACEAEGVEPYEWEVFEHWAVSGWLARRLEQAGERVAYDFAGFPAVWARTTTGQAIAADGVIREIAREIAA
ncbi:hypothetical protein [Enterovirga aerilata]|uniref:Uncharacterized protein n=1 Tax=Enterovirga aerilata TaxID=2730920 RepID=A0A849IEW4_9HYPH|nr:hypothetical protein [Enterovirga sp. DB1703]NNM74765.1 hypothetical protein [Enterovirga sp. DB1703]